MAAVWTNTMKKCLIVLWVLLAGVSGAQAGIGIWWDNGYDGWMVAYGANIYAGPGVAQNRSVLWQLVYAGANNAMDRIDWNAPNYLGGDDELLAVRRIPAGGGMASDGTLWNEWLMLVEGSTVYVNLNFNGEGDYVYQRVIQSDGHFYNTDLFMFNKSYSGGGMVPDSFSFDPEENGVAVDDKYPASVVTLDPPVLQVASASPSEGSLTLAWEDEGAGEGVTYAIWRGAVEERTEATCVTNGLTGNTWTDTNYWAADPVLKPLNYWVVADGGGYGERESEPVETRHRYALGVGVGRYRESRWETDESDITNVNLFEELVTGTFVHATLSGQTATHAAIRKKMQELADKVKTGDYVLVFCSSHGATSVWRELCEKMGYPWLLEFQGIVMYNTVFNVPNYANIYEPDEIKADLERCFSEKNGVSLAFILNCCMAGGVTACTPSNGNMAWIASCQESETTPTWLGFGTPLPKYLFEYGWKQGRAGNASCLTLANLLDYALPQMDVFLSKVERQCTPVVTNRDILEHFIVGKPGDARHTSAPGVPTGLEPTLSGKPLIVKWNNDERADFFIVRRTDAADDDHPVINIGGGSSEVLEFTDKSAAWYGKPYLYRIASLNEWGISDWTQPRLGACMWKEWMEWVAPYFGFEFEEVLPEELTAAATMTAANGTTYAGCYVAGLDPTDAHALFEAELASEDGQLKPQPKGGEKEGRVYSVWGKKKMDDEEWEDVTGVEDLEAEGWRFFKVGVDLAE